LVVKKKQTGSNRFLMKNDSLKGQFRINEQIRAKDVRIVGDDDIESKVYPIFQALKMAEEREMDLVEISPNAEPPVCRIIDYSKFLYQLKKRQKEQKAKQVKVNVKEIRFGPQTDDHDYDFKLKHAKGFLEDGDKVKAYVFFKGRSILFKEQGEVLLLRFANDLEDYAKVDQMPVLEGKRMTIFLSPKKKEGQKKVVSTTPTVPSAKLTVVKADKIVKVENSPEEDDDKEMRNAQV
jgi:translation initiation factor IF-3